MNFLEILAGGAISSLVFRLFVVVDRVCVHVLCQTKSITARAVPPAEEVSGFGWWSHLYAAVELIGLRSAPSEACVLEELGGTAIPVITR